jgi:hypothetical protein
MSEPFCYVAHKDGFWAGVISPSIGNRELAKFFREFASAGFTITPCGSREEYSAFLDTKGMWHDSPEYCAKHPQLKAMPEAKP